MDKKIKPKSRKMIQEAVDIIRNAEDDEAALAFLQDTLVDDYPDLDLGRMDLHEAIEILNKRENNSGDKRKIEDLNKSLADFLNFSKSKKSKRKRKRKRKK
jgi:hypothetical protein